jgi:hypothetical protein
MVRAAARRTPYLIRHMLTKVRVVSGGACHSHEIYLTRDTVGTRCLSLVEFVELIGGTEL